MIFAAGSPQEAWRVFESHYAVKSEHEREIVEDEWNELRQKEGESIVSFYGRAKAIRMKLESYGDKRPDASMCKHIARRMLPYFKLCSDHVLLLPDLSSRDRSTSGNPTGIDSPFDTSINPSAETQERTEPQKTRKADPTLCPLSNFPDQASISFF